MTPSIGPLVPGALLPTHRPHMRIRQADGRLVLTSVNSTTTSLSPVQHVKEWSQVLLRLFDFLAAVSPHEVVHLLANIDLSDAFWGVLVTEDDKWNFVYVLPGASTDPIRLVVSHALLMGWTENPGYCCATSYWSGTRCYSFDRGGQGRTATTARDGELYDPSVASANNWLCVTVGGGGAYDICVCERSYFGRHGRCIWVIVDPGWPRRPAPHNTRHIPPPIVAPWTERAQSCKKNCWRQMMHTGHRRNSYWDLSFLTVLLELSDCWNWKQLTWSPWHFQSVSVHCRAALHAATILPATRSLFTPINQALWGNPELASLEATSSKLRATLLDLRTLMLDLDQRPTHVHKLVTRPPDYHGYWLRCKCLRGWGGEVWFSGACPLRPHVWCLEWLHYTVPCIQ